MKYIVWNCIGTGYDQFLRSCKDILFREHPDVLCLVERKASSAIGKKLARKLKFDSLFEVPASAFVGGLILLWNSHSIKLKVLSCHDQAIKTEVSYLDEVIISSFVYVQPHVSAKEAFCFHLMNMSLTLDKPWLVMADFNDFALVRGKEALEIA